ncbi:hypothetical protein A3759_07365 [Thalassolituus sp. HI0120]|nr:hypothetical protein A3759_07365 [Thalassolituus sp. HI0120]
MESPLPRSEVPYRRLSLFYFLYFALLGCIAPFWGLFLQARDFNAEDIGLLMAAFAAIRILAPNVWAHVAGRFSSPMVMVRCAGVLTAVCFVGVWWANSFLSMLLVMLAYGFFWAAILPQYETITMQSLNNRIDDYSKIRLWGSVGFIVAVILLGWLFDAFSVNYLPAVMLVTMLLITVNSFSHSARVVVREGKRERNFISQALQKQVVVFILITVLLQISHGAYYTFFSIYLEQLGYSKSAIGLLWSLGVFSEVILFWQFHRLLHLLSWRGWVMMILILTAVRWLLISQQADQLVVLLIAQVLHAFSFGAMHAVSMRYIQHYFSRPNQAQGQALYSSIGFGLGGALGAWGCGIYWNRLGGEQVFVVSAVIATVAFLIAWTGLRREE